MMRRELLAGMVIAAVAAIPELSGGADMPSPGLAAHARRTHRGFGCAVNSVLLHNDPALAAAVIREVDMIVPEYELKRRSVQLSPDHYDFSGADALAAFSHEHGMGMRGHTLTWHEANPDWLEPVVQVGSAQDREGLLTGYINTVVQRYAGRISEWDVVNEAIEPNQGGVNGMRTNSLWWRAFGEHYIDVAFHAARAADPGARLFLNDYGIEQVGTHADARRTALLKLLDRLKSRGVPIDAIGIQGHLQLKLSFDESTFARFLDQLSGYDVSLAITEFDIADIGGPEDPTKRDAEVAALGRSFLDVALASRRMKSVLCWGLTDRFSWLSVHPDYRWPDGQLSRGLPLDARLNRKPLWNAMASSFDSAGKQ